MNRSGIVISNSKFRTPFTKLSAVKLLSVIGEKGMGNAETTYDRAPKKVYHVGGGDGSKCLGFGLLREVVYCDKKEFPSSFSRWHGSDYVNPPFREWPGRADRIEFFRGVFHHPSKPLTLVALLN
jgi:hypothetical protein